MQPVSLQIKKTRIGIKKREQLTEKLLIIGTNANGLQSKKNSFSNLLPNYQPQVATVQETKMKRQGPIAIQGYELLKELRQAKLEQELILGDPNKMSLLKAKKRSKYGLCATRCKINP